MAETISNTTSRFTSLCVRRACCIVPALFPGAKTDIGCELDNSSLVGNNVCRWYRGFLTQLFIGAINSARESSGIDLWHTYQNIQPSKTYNNTWMKSVRNEAG